MAKMKLFQNAVTTFLFVIEKVIGKKELKTLKGKKRVRKILL